MGIDIYKVSQVHYIEAAKTFIKQLETFVKGKNLTEGEIAQAEGALNIAESYLTTGPNVHKFIALKISGGLVVGLMTLKTEPTEVKVDDICTTPTEKGVGKKLIERAVQFSEKLGKNGRLTLTDMSKPRETGGKTFYDALGFMAVPGEQLMKKLNPNTAVDKWAKGPKSNLWKTK